MTFDNHISICFRNLTELMEEYVAIAATGDRRAQIQCYGLGNDAVSFMINL